MLSSEKPKALPCPSYLPGRGFWGGFRAGPIKEGRQARAHATSERWSILGSPKVALSVSCKPYDAGQEGGQRAVSSQWGQGHCPLKENYFSTHSISDIERVGFPGFCEYSTGVPTISFTSDTNCLQLAQTLWLRLGLKTLPSRTLDANCKSWVPMLSVLLSDLTTNWRFPCPTFSSVSIICSSGSQNSGKHVHQFIIKDIMKSQMKGVVE